MDLNVVIVELFNRIFPGCRELDIKLNPEKVNILVNIIICNGTVINTSIDDILAQYNELTARNDLLTTSMAKISSWTSMFKYK